MRFIIEERAQTQEKPKPAEQDELISKKDTLARVKLLKEEFESQGLVFRANVVACAMEIIAGTPPAPLVGLKTATAPLLCELEPWFPDALTGRDVYRCGQCFQQVKKTDIYCRHCGRRLIRGKEAG